MPGILLLLKARGRTAAVEGVETLHHGKAWLAMDCALTQGYGIAKPLPVDQMKCRVVEFERAPPWGRGQATDENHGLSGRSVGRYEGQALRSNRGSPFQCSVRMPLP
ncbi:hypothetical protein [Variovorax boronicumulans]|uniref:hypothetical protein n=1 Tax=Variovorax boronicumulans TaxID=436515 RepID=UPI0012E5B0D9|nr:hypothetical protein [Variovorax boronicumulans]GER21366.1 hypothetical protein VCH24_64180 [Variovorax boronicumulans]